MRRNPGYWKNLVIYGLATWLYALGLSALLTSLTSLPFGYINQGIVLLFLVGLWLLILSFPKSSFIVVIATLTVTGLWLWSGDENWQRFLDTRLFAEIDATLRAFMYFIGSRDYLVPETGYFLRLFSIATSLFSVIVLWRLGWYLIAFMALAASLYFQLQLPGERWLLWLGLGLLGLLLVASRQNTKGRRQIAQRPILLPIILILVLTFGLGKALPARWFFSPKLAEWVNDFDDKFRTFDADARGLFTFGGGYDKDSSPINGLINRRNDPFLKVYGPPYSFYLRGSIFTEFSGRTWYAQDVEWTNFPDTTDFQLMKVMDPFQTFAWRIDLPLEQTTPPEDWPEGQPWPAEVELIPPRLNVIAMSLSTWFDHFGTQMVVVEPLHLPQRTVYGPNAMQKIEPGDFALGQDGARFDISGVSSEHYYYDTTGQVRRHFPETDIAYRMEGLYVRTANQEAEELLEYADIFVSESVPSGTGMTATLGARTYAETVQARDPALYDILYGELDGLGKVRMARDYIASNYTYNLNVTAVPTNRDFLDWFLETKTGYCVHYGSALTLLLRDVGINSRYVEGFVAGETPETEDGQLYLRTITTNQAHAWTEVYLTGLGWYPFDATPPAEVERLNRVSVTRVIAETNFNPEDDIPPERDMPERDPADRIEQDPDAIESDPQLSEADASGSVEIPWRWVIRLIVILYFSWRHWVWKTRHHLGWIRWRYRGREDVMVKRIFRDIQELHQLGGYSLPHTWGSKQRFDDVLENSPALDYDNAAFAEQAIEQVFYAERTPNERQLAGLLSYHKKLELRVRNKLSWAEWFVRRYAWSSRHPL